MYLSKKNEQFISSVSKKLEENFEQKLTLEIETKTNLQAALTKCETENEQLNVDIIKYKHELKTTNDKTNKIITENEQLNVDIIGYKHELKTTNDKTNKIIAENKQLNVDIIEYKHELKTTNDKTNKSIAEKDKLQKKIHIFEKIVKAVSATPEQNEKTSALNQIWNIFHQINEFCTKNDLLDDYYLIEFKQLIEKIEESVRFPIFTQKNIIGLCGHFSSGKTSVVNSILGEDVLPTSIEPTTALNTYIIHPSDYLKTEGLFICNFKSGQEKIEEDSYKLITHSFDVSVKEMIKYVTLNTTKLDFLNIALLDTPGITGQGQLNVSETDKTTALKGLSNAVCLLWIGDAEKGSLTDDDIIFLKRDEVYEKPLMIIYNKAETRTKHDIDKIIENTGKILREYKFVNYEIIPYSAHYSLEYKNSAKKIKKFIKNIDKIPPKIDYSNELIEIFTKFIKNYENLEKEYKLELETFSKANALIDLNDNNRKVSDEITKFRQAIQKKLVTIKDAMCKFDSYKGNCLEQIKIITD